MKLFAAAAIVAASLITPAAAWDIDKMNEQIEKTNVIVSEICSGTIIDAEKRLVLTAHHCITENLKEVEKKEVDPITGEITVKKVVEKTPMYVEVWKRQDYAIVSLERHSAKIKAYDSTSDIAILEVTDKSWKPAMVAPLASDNYEYKRGKTIFAVGNPGIQFDNSLTEGIISAPERIVNFGSGDIPMFQHSASIIGGSSGGAIYNDSGEIIGTVSAGVRGANIGLAVPVSKTKELIKRMNTPPKPPTTSFGGPY